MKNFRQFRNFRTYQHIPSVWGSYREALGYQESQHERDSISHGQFLFLLCFRFEIVRKVVVCEPLSKKLLLFPTKHERHGYE